MININDQLCVGCGECAKECFPGHLILEDKTITTTQQRCLLCGHCVAICPTGAVSIAEYDMTEVKPYDQEHCQVDSEQLLTFMQFRRTVRHYQARAVESAKIQQIIEAGRYSPTGSNKQMVSYVVVQEQLPAIREMAIQALYDACEEANPFSAKWQLMYEKNKIGQDLLFYHAPVLLVVVEDSSNPSDVDAGLAASRMELMANALGLGCCFNGFFVRAVAQAPEIKKMLGLTENHRLVTSICVGYPDVQFQRTAPRKKAVVRWV